MHALTVSLRWPFVRCFRAHAPSLQQSLQRFAFPRSLLTVQPGTAAPRVHSARLALAKRACHAASATRLPYTLGAVPGQRFTQHQRSVVARLASDHGADAFSQPGECCEQGGQAERTESRHGAEGLNAHTHEREDVWKTVHGVKTPQLDVWLHV